MSKIPWHNRSHCNRTHIDEGVLRYFYDSHDCRSMIDLGCGPGGQVEAAQAMGYKATGVDGDPEVKPLVLHDFLDGPCPYLPTVDLIWCNEFLEHIPEDKLGNVISVFDHSLHFATITAHEPGGKPNKFHHNEQGVAYWIEKFESQGWIYSATATGEAREASTMKRDFFREQGLVFIR